MECCIVYLSTATKLLSTEELKMLLYQWQEKNRAQGITGVLLYFNGSIIQVLEGNQEKLETLYQLIAKDTRHMQVTRLYKDLIEQRSFGDWSMGFKTLSESDLNHLGDLIITDGFPWMVKQDQKNIVRRIVQIFYQNNFLN